MSKKTEHFDENLDFGISPEFSADLKALFKPDFSIPSEVDQSILDKAREQLAPKHWGHRVLRHISIWRVAAAAAVIILAFSLNLTQKSGTSVHESLVDTRAVDIDGSGRVDILDAFKLARSVESAGPIEKQWDINGDGLVNGNDVDLVASAAVRLPEPVPPAEKTRMQTDKGVL